MPFTRKNLRADLDDRAVVHIAKRALKMYEMHLQMAEAAL